MLVSILSGKLNKVWFLFVLIQFLLKKGISFFYTLLNNRIDCVTLVNEILFLISRINSRVNFSLLCPHLWVNMWTRDQLFYLSNLFVRYCSNCDILWFFGLELIVSICWKYVYVEWWFRSIFVSFCSSNILIGYYQLIWITYLLIFECFPYTFNSFILELIYMIFD